jgi:hypothetical protein
MVHGLAWTDGKVIYLSQVNVVAEKLEITDVKKLGEFRFVNIVL